MFVPQSHFQEPTLGHLTDFSRKQRMIGNHPIHSGRKQRRYVFGIFHRPDHDPHAMPMNPISRIDVDQSLSRVDVLCEC